MNGCRHILVAFDGAPHSDRALTIAIELARGAHARLTILTATRQVPCPAYTGAATEAVAVLSRTVTSDAERTLCEAVRRVPDDVSVTKVCTHEPIRAAILRRIEEGAHDLVVLGSRGRGPIRSAVPGGVGSYIRRHSPVPVLIVHPPMPRADEAASTRPVRPLGGATPHAA